MKKNNYRLVPGTINYWGDILGNIEEQKDLIEYISTHSGGGTEAVWGSISGNISNQSDLMETLSSYALLSDIPSLEGYATESWVSAQGYLTSETIPSDIATQSWVESQGYLTEHQSLDGYATESWVSGQGFAYSNQLDNYVYDSQHRLNLTGEKPLVDDKEIAVTDQCFINRSYSYPGPRIEGVAGFSGMSVSYENYFVTPSGRLIYTDLDNQVAYEFNGTQWVQLQTVTNFVNILQRVELNDGLYIFNKDDSGLYRWDDTNSDWEFIIQAPSEDIWAGDANTLRCSNNFKLVNNGGTYEWEEDSVNNYPGNIQTVKLGQNYYYIHWDTQVYTYDESQKIFTMIGNTIVEDRRRQWFTYDGCLYYITETGGVRKVDPTQVGTENWDTQTYIYYSDAYNPYVEYDNKLWTAVYNYSLGYYQLGYTYDITESAPAVPNTNGTYVLKAVRTNAGVTYSWVEDVDAQAIQITNEILG